MGGLHVCFNGGANGGEEAGLLTSQLPEVTAKLLLGGDRRNQAFITHVDRTVVRVLVLFRDCCGEGCDERKVRQRAVPRSRGPQRGSSDSRNAS